MKPTIRCSELDRILSCPGSRVLAELVAPRVGSEGAKGTLIHAHIARRLWIDEGAQVDRVYEKLEPLIGFDAWIAKFCEDDVKDNTPPDWSLEVEAEYAYDMGEFILTGHPDAVAINPDVTEAIAWDYKTGNKPVDIAERNEQVLGYIILLWFAYPTLRRMRFRIVQPLNDEDQGFPRVSEVTVEWQADQIINRFVGRVVAALAQSGIVESGLKQCAWCPVAGPQCPAQNMEIDFMKAQLTPELLAKIKKEPDDALLADFVISARTIARGVDDAEELLHKRLDVNPQIVAGCGVRVTRTTVGGSYKVNDPVKMMAALKSVLPEPAIAKVVNYPIGKIRDAIAENLKIPKTGAAANTAEKVSDAKFGHLLTQGTRRLLQFQ